MSLYLSSERHVAVEQSLINFPCSLRKQHDRMQRRSFKSIEISFEIEDVDHLSTSLDILRLCELQQNSYSAKVWRPGRIENLLHIVSLDTSANGYHRKIAKDNKTVIGLLRIRTPCCFMLHKLS